MRILDTALSVDNYFLARRLINKGANVNAANNEGYTPLMYAASSDQYLPVLLLLEKGADVNAVDKNNETPLQMADRSGEESICNLLRGWIH